MKTSVFFPISIIFMILPILLFISCSRDENQKISPNIYPGVNMTDEVRNDGVQMGHYYLDAGGCDIYSQPGEGQGSKTGVWPGDKKFDAVWAYCSDAEPCKKEGLLVTYLCGTKKDCWYGARARGTREINQWVRVDCVQGIRPMFEEGD